MEELQGLLLQLVQLNAIFTAQRQLLLHLQLLRAVMQQRSHSCLFNIRAIALCQPDRLLLRSQHMGDALVLEIAQRHRAKL